MKYWTHGKYGLALTSALACSACPTFAQDNQAEATDDEVVELSPFVVETSKDVGYMATNAISGTRLNTSIKAVPMNLEVITSKFIKDTGATNLREALRYSAGLVLSSQSDAFADPDTTDLTSAGVNDPRGVTRSSGDSNTKMRGFVSDTMLQDGFHRNFSADTIGIERVEVLRGPSALLYGAGNFGGVINYITKKPVWGATMTHVGTTIGSYGLHRFEFDQNFPLVSEESAMAKYQPTFRVSSAFQENEDYTQYYNQSHWVVNAALSFKPLENTTITVSSEIGYKSEYGVGFQNIRSTVGSSGGTRAATWATDIYSPVDGSKIGQNVDNRTFRWSGDDTYLKGPYRNFTVDLEQKFSDDLYLKVGYSRSHYEFNSRQIVAAMQNEQIQSGTTDSYTSKYFGTTFSGRTAALCSTFYSNTFGEAESGDAPDVLQNAVIRYYWQDVNRVNDRDQLRAELMYRKDLGSWGVHTLVAGLTYEKLQTVEDVYRPAVSWTGDAETGGVSHTIANYDIYSYKSVSDYSPFVYGTQGDGVPDNPQVHWTSTTDKTSDVAYYAVYQGQFFNDKLTAVGGLRWDRTDASNVVDRVYQYDMVTDYNGSGGATTEISPQYGLSYAVTDWFTVFGVYSTGIVPNYYSRDGNNDLLDPTEAKNIELGVKFDLFDGKLSGTVSAYRIERTGVPYAVWWAPNVYNAIDTGYDATDDTKTVVWYASPVLFYHALHESDTYSVAEATAIAKKIWPECWWPLIDEIANSNYVLPANYTDADLVNFGPISAGPSGNADWYNNDVYVYSNTATNNFDMSSEYYFPLVNFSDEETAAFFEPILSSTGWCANYYGTMGATYRYGDGTTDTYNAANTTGASVALDDKAEGWDCSLTWTPFPELQVVTSFSHLKRKVTTKSYKFVSAAFCPGASWLASDNNYGTLDKSLTFYDVYTDVNDASTYTQTILLYDQPADDSPENTFSIWAHYELSHMTDALKGWAVGFGAQWEDGRLWFTGVNGGNVEVVRDTRILVQRWTDERTTLNGLIEYKTKLMDKYDLRLALNIDNIANDKQDYGLVYADGRSFRVSASIDF